MAKVNDPLSLYAEGIKATGFPLEYRVMRILQEKGWSVITNKYYLDDTEEGVREMDLLAYRVSEVQHLKVATVIVISCKKSEGRVWALLSRKPNYADPNANWTPVHAWTNDRALDHERGLPAFSADLYAFAEQAGVTDALRRPTADIFAFQELDKNTGKPQNDKAMFASVSSLMKAQAYELSVLPKRRKGRGDTRLYQFNLMTVLDGELVRLDFESDKIKAVNVDGEQYVASYIVNKEQTFARVHFTRIGHLENVLSDYGELHKANCKFVSKRLNVFYETVFVDDARCAVFSPDFFSSVGFWMESLLKRAGNANVQAKDASLSWDSKGSAVKITWNVSAEEVAKLNADKPLRHMVASALKKYYPYTGPFRFVEDDIPF